MNSTGTQFTLFYFQLRGICNILDGEEVLHLWKWKDIFSKGEKLIKFTIKRILKQSVVFIMAFPLTFPLLLKCAMWYMFVLFFRESGYSNSNPYFSCAARIGVCCCSHNIHQVKCNKGTSPNVFSNYIMTISFLTVYFKWSHRIYKM